MDWNEYLQLAPDGNVGYPCHPKHAMQMRMALDDRLCFRTDLMRNPSMIDLPHPCFPFLGPFPRPFSLGLDPSFGHPPLLPNPRLLPPQHLPGDFGSGYGFQDAIPPTHGMHTLPGEAGNAAFHAQYQAHMSALQNQLHNLMNSSRRPPQLKHSFGVVTGKERLKRRRRIAGDPLLSPVTTTTMMTTPIMMTTTEVDSASALGTAHLSDSRLPALPKLHALGRHSSPAHPTRSPSSPPPPPIRGSLINPPPLHVPIIKLPNLHSPPPLRSTTEFKDERNIDKKRRLRSNESCRIESTSGLTLDVDAFNDFVETDFNLRRSIADTPKLPPPLSIGNKDLASKLNKETNEALNLSSSKKYMQAEQASYHDNVVGQSPEDMMIGDVIRSMENNVVLDNVATLNLLNGNSFANGRQRRRLIDSGEYFQDNTRVDSDYLRRNILEDRYPFVNPFFPGAVDWSRSNPAFSPAVNKRTNFPLLANHFPSDVDVMRAAYTTTTSSSSVNHEKSSALVSPSMAATSAFSSPAAEATGESNFRTSESRKRRRWNDISPPNSRQPSLKRFTSTSSNRLKEMIGELGDLPGYETIRRNNVSEPQICWVLDGQVAFENDDMVIENHSDVIQPNDRSILSNAKVLTSIDVKQEIDEITNVTRNVNGGEIVNRWRRSNGKEEDSTDLIVAETDDERLFSSDGTRFIVEGNSSRGGKVVLPPPQPVSSDIATKRLNSNSNQETNDFEDDEILSTKDAGVDYRCHLCSYNGRSQHCLKKHLSAHGQTCKMCRFCQKAFERPSDLVRHEERHQKRNRSSSLAVGPDDRPLQSVQFKCGRRLRRRCFWNCRQCSFSCNEAKKLIEHKRTSHPIECRLCRTKFPTEDELRSHVATYHTTSVARLDVYDRNVLTSTRLVACELTAPQEITLNLDDPFLELPLDCSDIPEVSNVCDVRCILGKADVCPSASERLADSGQVPPVDMCILPPLSANAGQVCVNPRSSFPFSSTLSDVGQVPSVDTDKCLSRLPSSLPFAGQDSTTEPAFSAYFKSLSSRLSDERSTANNNEADTFGLNNSSSETTRNKYSSSVALVSMTNTDHSNNTKRVVAAVTEATTVDRSSVSIDISLQEQTLNESTFRNHEECVGESEDINDSNISIPPPVREIISSTPVSSPSGATPPPSLSSSLPPPLRWMKIEETESPVLRSLVLKLKIHREGKSEKIQILRKNHEKCALDESGKEQLNEKHRKPNRRLKEKCRSELNTTSTVSIDSLKDKNKAETKAPSTATSKQVFKKCTGSNSNTESSESTFVCVRCKYSTNAKFKYQQHLKAHNGRFVCKKCNKACIKSSDLYRHWATHNVKGSDGHFACDSCDFTSPQKYALEDHMKRHYSLYPEYHRRQTSLMSRCGFCRKNVLRSRLFEHKRLVHGRFFEKQRPSDDVVRDANDNRVKRPSKMFVCPQCDRKFTTPSYLLRHHFVSHPRRTATEGDKTSEDPGCRFCGVIIEDVDRLHQHEINHVLRNCSDSEKRKNVHHSSSLTDVIEATSSKQKFISSVKRSPRKRSSRRRMKCPQCTRCFKTQYFLDQHLRTHGDERPFACLSCGAGFALVQSLNVHQRLKCPNRGIVR